MGVGECYELVVGGGDGGFVRAKRVIGEFSRRVREDDVVGLIVGDV